MKSEKKLTVAEKEVVKQMRKWPSLYPNAMSVFLDCIVSGTGDFRWNKDGLLVCEEKQMKSRNGKPKPYPFRISEEVAIELMNKTPLFYSVHCYGEGVLDRMPDNMHDDWLSFISLYLFICSKVTPELYKTTMKSHCIMYYGMEDNPYANYSNYEREWDIFYKRIESYRARINEIRTIKETGKIPASKYQGMDI